MFGYVYITTNLINGKKYIGKKESSVFVPEYLGSGKLIKRAIKKYGKENFIVEVLQWCETADKLNQAERYYIKLNNAQQDPMYYNISEGGDWGDISQGLTPEQYKQWGNKIRKHHTGTTCSEETKQKMSKSRKRYFQEGGFSEETIEKMRINNAGKSNPHYGKKQTEYHKQRIIETQGKSVTVTLPDKTILDFITVAECIRYMKEHYNVSRFLTKRLLKDNTPLQLPEKERNRYPHIYVLNGMTVTYKN